MTRVYTIPELEAMLPEHRVRGEQQIVHEGKLYAAFICHGCQSCWQFTDERCTQLVECYPHFLGSKRIDPQHGAQRQLLPVPGGAPEAAGTPAVHSGV